MDNRLPAGLRGRAILGKGEMMSDHYDRYNGMDKLLGTNLAEVGTDCISRQAAIDELVKMLGYCFQADEELVDAVVTTINELPPSEPDIIYCKDCKHFDPIYTDGTGVCGHWNAKTKTNAYCAYAERRKDG